ncbi:hypothetical protein TNCV_3128271 [Trichonephila clavipes]|nr:hypothetical protein TNCV_3128271 [Trichonephila clavipes]
MRFCKITVPNVHRGSKVFGAIGVVRNLGEEVPAQVSSSSLDSTSKLRDPSPIALAQRYIAKNEKVSNHGSIPITIDCNLCGLLIVFEEGFHQPIKRTKQLSFSGCNGVSTYTCELASLQMRQFVDVAIQPEMSFIAKQNSLMKIDHYFRNKIAQFESVVQA